MPTALGAHNSRVEFARSLLSKKGRRESGRFAFEGPTLLAEAVRSGIPVEALYATPRAFETTPLARELEARGVPVYTVDDRTMGKLSDVETPSGLVAIAPIALHALGDLLAEPGVVLVLADIGDPGNAGTLLRSAEAFGVDRVVFGSLGVEPHNPKVVRAAMGTLFRCRLAVAEPAALQAAAAGWQITGLSAQGEPLAGLRWSERCVLVIGSERSGLGRWEGLCGRLGAIPMPGPTESLNAAVAGSIALYETARGKATQARRTT